MEQFEICVTSELTNLASIAEFVTQRALVAGMNEDQAFEVQMAVDEACTNAIEHAYQGRSDGNVWICCYIEGDDFVVRVTDEGQPFDPSIISSPDTKAPLEEREIGGLGLFFMQKLMDSVVFLPGRNRGNQVIMRKSRRTAV
ncbi:MAG TPA: ATP-binding protein [Chloroflexi bacterium]|jgi:anti-sigma regulatory factor (Ser/Thr protein kinase)|nr:ATP-binding protein [Chloroflexota bacterium]